MIYKHTMIFILYKNFFFFCTDIYYIKTQTFIPDVINSVITVFGNHSKRDSVSGVFDKLNDVVVRELHDGLTVHGGYAVAHAQQAAAVGRAALDYTADFMRDYCNTHLFKSLSSISSFLSIQAINV